MVHQLHIVLILSILAFSSLAIEEEGKQRAYVPRHKGRSHKLVANPGRSSWSHHKAMVAADEQKSVDKPFLKEVMEQLGSLEEVEGVAKMAQKHSQADTAARNGARSNEHGERSKEQGAAAAKAQDEEMKQKKVRAYGQGKVLKATGEDQKSDQNRSPSSMQSNYKNNVQNQMDCLECDEINKSNDSRNSKIFGNASHTNTTTTHNKKHSNPDDYRNEMARTIPVGEYELDREIHGRNVEDDDSDEEEIVNPDEDEPRHEQRTRRVNFLEVEAESATAEQLRSRAKVKAISRRLIQHTQKLAKELADGAAFFKRINKWKKKQLPNRGRPEVPPSSFREDRKSQLQGGHENPAPLSMFKSLKWRLLPYEAKQAPTDISYTEKGWCCTCVVKKQTPDGLTNRETCMMNSTDTGECAILKRGGSAIDDKNKCDEAATDFGQGDPVGTTQGVVYDENQALCLIVAWTYENHCKFGQAPKTVEEEHMRTESVSTPAQVREDQKSEKTKLDKTMAASTKLPKSEEKVIEDSKNLQNAFADADLSQGDSKPQDAMSEGKERFARILGSLRDLKRESEAMEKEVSSSNDPLIVANEPPETDATNEEEQEGEDPFEPMADLVDSIVDVSEGLDDLKSASQKDRILKSADRKLKLAVTTVTNMADAQEESDDKLKDGMQPARNTDELLEDKDETDDTKLEHAVQSIVTESNAEPDEEVKEDGEGATDVEDLELDDDGSVSDAYTQMLLCQSKSGPDCSACDDKEFTELRQYQDCVKETILKHFQKANEKQQDEHKQKVEKERAKLRKQVEKSKDTTNRKRQALWLANDALQIWGVHRNWAQWTTNPMWPLETLSLEPAKSGWAEFTAQSETILTTHGNDFLAEAATTAESEALASGQWAYDTYAATHAEAANEILQEVPGLDTVAGDISATIDANLQAGANFGEALGNTVQGVGQDLENTYQAAANTVGEVGDSVQGAVEGAGDVVEGVTEVAEGVGEGVAAAGEDVVNSGVPQLLESGTALQTRGELLQADMDATLEGLSACTDPLSCDMNMIQGLPDTMQGFSTEAAGISQDAAALGNDAATVGSNAASSMHAEAVSNAGDMFTEAATEAAASGDLVTHGMNNLAAHGDQLASMVPPDLSLQAEAFASADYELIGQKSAELGKAVANDMADPETWQSLLNELLGLAKRILSEIGNNFLDHLQTAAMEILNLVPDLLMGCLEAALDIVTGFGFAITATRILYKLAKYGLRKWREYRNNRPQKLCSKAPQLDCCVNELMKWYKGQALDRARDRAKFLADTDLVFLKQDGGFPKYRKFLPAALAFPSNQCTAWAPSLYSAPSKDLAFLQSQKLLDGALDNDEPLIEELNIVENTAGIVTGDVGNAFKMNKKKWEPGVLYVSAQKLILHRTRIDQSKGLRDQLLGTSVRWWESECRQFVPNASYSLKGIQGLRAFINTDFPPESGYVNFFFGKKRDSLKFYVPITSMEVEETNTTSSCQNNHENCPAWAQTGECEKNPGYMLVECKLSCGQCDGTDDRVTAASGPDVLDDQVCAVAAKLCHGSCLKKSECDDNIDPHKRVVQEAMRAKKPQKLDLVQMCASTTGPTSGLVAARVAQFEANRSVDEPASSEPSEPRTESVQEAQESEELQNSPIQNEMPAKNNNSIPIKMGKKKFAIGDVRSIVWDQLFNGGEGDLITKSEARVGASEICEQHVLPHWYCGFEECAICRFVGTLAQKDVNPSRWCSTFEPTESEKVLDKLPDPRETAVGRDASRFHKCKYIEQYFRYTGDHNAFGKNTLSVEKQCETRGFCRANGPKLPKAYLRAKVTDEENENRRCILCVDFVQMAAAKISPKTYCQAISNKYPVEQKQCEAQLDEVRNKTEAIQHFFKKGRLSIFFPKPKVNGTACDTFCEGMMKRNPEMLESLSNRSPLLLAGQDFGFPKAGPVPEDDGGGDEPTTESKKLKKLQKKLAKERKKMRKNLGFLSLEDAVQKVVADRRAFSKQLTWEAKFTTKRVWPRKGPHGTVTRKMEEFNFLMLNQAVLMQPHIDLAEELFNTGELNDMRNAVKVIEDLYHRVKQLLQDTELIPMQLDEITPPTVPSGLNRKRQKRLNDMKANAKCFEGMIERYEKFQPTFEALSNELQGVAKELDELRSEMSDYSCESIGLNDIISQMYLMLPKQRQGRLTKIWAKINPVNIFKTRFVPDDMYSQDDKVCSSRAVRKVSFERLPHLLHCCTDRRHQVMLWESSIVTTFQKLNQVKDMMGDVKGNILTRNIRKAGRKVKDLAKAGAETLTGGLYTAKGRTFGGFWVQEEAAGLLRDVAKEFSESIAKNEARNKNASQAMNKFVHSFWEETTDRKFKNCFRKTSRFDTVKQNAKDEIRKSRESFEKVQERLRKVAVELKTKVEAQLLDLNE